MTAGWLGHLTSAAQLVGQRWWRRRAIQRSITVHVSAGSHCSSCFCQSRLTLLCKRGMPLSCERLGMLQEGLWNALVWFAGAGVSKVVDVAGGVCVCVDVLQGV